MTKKQKYLKPAEKLYVERELTLGEIAEHVPVSYATLRKWKQSEKWDIKRKEYKLAKEGFHQELYELGRKLSAECRKDFDEGRKVSASRLYALGRIMDIVDKTHRYELKVSEKIKQKKDVSLKDIVKVLNEKLFSDDQS